MRPKISVIVPIYNAELYLEECIESVLNQTLRDIELLLIDDGSTDNSFLICEKYKKRDNRIQLYNNKNVDKIRIEVGVAWPYGNHNYTKPGEKLVGSKIAYIKTFNFTREDYKDFLKQYKEEN